MKIRLARQGEGKEVARLAEMALQGHTQGSEVGDLAEAIDADGGTIKVPFGRAYVFVVEEDGAACGMMYVTPPVRLTESYAERGPEWQKRFAERVAEVQLMAVSEELRGRGLAWSLAATAEEALRRRGVRALVLKVLADDEPVQRWYGRQGYKILGPGEYALLRVGGMDVPIASEGSIYRVGVKRISPDQI
jgi:ribosomal protein S18 acetylase RimI-like enzyme